MSNSSSTTSIFINAQTVVNETDNYLDAKLPLFSETPEESVLNCYDNAPLRASFRAPCSTPASNRHSCFVCRRTPGPALPFGIKMIVCCHIRHFLIRGYKGRFRHKSFLFLYHSLVLD